MNPKALVQKLDRYVGSPLATLQSQNRLRTQWSRFERDRELRKARYRDCGFSVQVRTAIVEQLNREGYAVIPDALDRGLISAIRDEMEQHLNAGTGLSPVARDSARTPGDLELPRVFLSPDELAAGQSHYRQHTNHAAIKEPLISCPSVVAAAFQELLIDIAAGYVECFPAMTGLNLRKSFVNDLPEFDTLYFHSDPNSPRFIKFFMYLNDVDENGGPFTYVRGSHRRKFRGWTFKYRWTYEEIARAYGAENILNLTARVGDLLMADTTGFHRGTKVRSADRSMLTVDYLVHEEFEGKAPRFRIRSADYDRLSAKQKAAADFLDRVE